MTVQKHVQRAGLRVMMAESMRDVPEYSADPKVINRVGVVIGETASHEERHVRESDGLLRSTSIIAPVQQDRNSGPNVWLWSISLGMFLCTVGLLGVLAYWQFS